MKHLAALFQALAELGQPMPAVVSPTEIRVQQSKEQEQPTREGSAKKINRSHHQSYILSENRVQIRDAIFAIQREHEHDGRPLAIAGFDRRSLCLCVHASNEPAGF
jgi:hypothetical protein